MKTFHFGVSGPPSLNQVQEELTWGRWFCEYGCAPCASFLQYSNGRCLKIFAMSWFLDGFIWFLLPILLKILSTLKRLFFFFFFCLKEQIWRTTHRTSAKPTVSSLYNCLWGWLPFNYIRSSKPFTSGFSLHISNRKIIKSKYWFCNNKWKQRRQNSTRRALPNPGSEGAPPCCSCRKQALSVWELSPKGPHSSRLKGVQISEQQNIWEKSSLDVKPEPGVTSHDRHESGVFTSSIPPNSEVSILSQDSISK